MQRSTLLALRCRQIGLELGEQPLLEGHCCHWGRSDTHFDRALPVDHCSLRSAELPPRDHQRRVPARKGVHPQIEPRGADAHLHTSSVPHRSHLHRLLVQPLPLWSAGCGIPLCQSVQAAHSPECTEQKEGQAARQGGYHYAAGTDSHWNREQQVPSPLPLLLESVVCQQAPLRGPPPPLVGLPRVSGSSASPAAKRGTVPRPRPGRVPPPAAAGRRRCR